MINSELKIFNSWGDLFPATFGKSHLKLVVLLLVLIVMLSGCAVDLNDMSETGDKDSKAENGVKNTVMEKQTQISGFTKPPIDQDVPENLETATLGMG